MTFKRILIFSIAILALLTGIFIGPFPFMFVDTVSLLFMILIPMPIMYATQGKRAFLFYKEKGLVKNTLIDQWSRMLFATASTTVVIGIVQMLTAIKDPYSIGPALAIALLTLFYACLMKLFLLEPFRDLEV